MRWTLFVTLLILWLFGLINGYTMGGVIHILLVIAIVVTVIQVIQGRRSSETCNGPVHNKRTERSKHYEEEKYLHRLFSASYADRHLRGL